MRRGTSPDHPMECPCSQCFLLRVSYALLVGKNHHDITSRDHARALLMITHGLMIEEMETPR